MAHPPCTLCLLPTARMAGPQRFSFVMWILTGKPCGSTLSYATRDRLPRSTQESHGPTSLACTLIMVGRDQHDQWALLGPGALFTERIGIICSCQYEFDRPFHNTVRMAALVPFIYHVFSFIALRVREIKSLGGAIFSHSARFSPRLEARTSCHLRCREYLIYTC